MQSQCDVLHQQDTRNRNNESISRHSRYTPHNVHVRTLSPGQWADVLPESYSFECPEKATPYMRSKLINHIGQHDYWSSTSDEDLFDSEYHDLCKSSTKTGGGLLTSVLSRSSFIPGQKTVEDGAIRKLCSGENDLSGGSLLDRTKVYTVCQLLTAPYADSFTPASLPADRIEWGTEVVVPEKSVDVKPIDGGSTDQSAVPALIRNGATRVISILGHLDLNETNYKKIADLSEEDFAK